VGHFSEQEAFLGLKPFAAAITSHRSFCKVRGITGSAILRFAKISKGKRYRRSCTGPYKLGDILAATAG